VAAVAAAMRSGDLAAGEQVRRFEVEVAALVEQRYGVATSSGTAALHLSLLALGVGEGEEVILPAYTCAAVLNAVHQARATPVLCDVDEETGNLSPGEVRGRVGPRTRAVIVVHSFGHPADLSSMDEARPPVIEDCSQALGARWRGRPVGGYGLVSVLSFYATKVITTGVGGMACTSDPRLAERMRSLRECDKHDHYEVRYNCQMSDLQASLGLSQLARLPEALRRRRALAAEYSSTLSELDVRLPPSSPDCEPVFYRYVVRVPDVDWAISAFGSRAVECKRPVYRPLHHYLPGASGHLPNTDRVYSEALSLPLYPALSRQEVRLLLGAAQEVLVARSPAATATVPRSAQADRDGGSQSLATAGGLAAREQRPVRRKAA